jgi:hypothetical protein
MERATQVASIAARKAAIHLSTTMVMGIVISSGEDLEALTVFSLAAQRARSWQSENLHQFLSAHRNARIAAAHSPAAAAMKPRSLPGNTRRTPIAM